MNKALLTSKNDLWETPQWFFDRLNKEFDFQTDVCALPNNAKCANYFTPEINGLNQWWTGSCWMNPPYGRLISRWVAKAMLCADHGALVACLVPARTDTKWWWDHCRNAEIRFIKGRLKFSNAKNCATFPSALVIFHPRLTYKNVVWWE